MTPDEPRPPTTAKSEESATDASGNLQGPATLRLEQLRCPNWEPRHPAFDIHPSCQTQVGADTEAGAPVFPESLSRPSSENSPPTCSRPGFPS
jgi:hypothetical protein